MATPEHSPTLEIRHKTQQSHDSGAYIDWNSDSGSPTRKNSGELSMSYIGNNVEGEFVTVVAVEGDLITTSNSEQNITEIMNNNDDASFVTVLSIGDEQQQLDESKTIMNVSELTSELGSESSSKISTSGSDDTHSKCEIDDEESEEVLVYRLPGERLGFGLKFEGGTKTHELVRRLFIQSCAADSPASRARCSWGELGEGDEILEIDGAAVNAMTRLDCVRCLKESQVVIKLRVQHGEKFTEIPLNNDESTTNLPLVVSEIKKTPPSPPPIPPRKAPRKTPALPPKDAVPIGPPSGFTDESARTPPTPRLRQPPQPEVYLDLLAQEELAAMNAESESDDTGSSISTVVDRSLSNSSFSDIRATTPIDLAKVLSPFEQLEREMSADAEYMAESSSLSETPSFDETLDSLPIDEVEELTANIPSTGETLQPPECFKDTDNKENISVIENSIDERGDGNDKTSPILPPKPAPRKDGSPSKFKSGKKRPPPPPPPRQDRPQAPQPIAAPRPPVEVVVVPEALATPPSSPECDMQTPPDFNPPSEVMTPPSSPDAEDGVVDAAFLVTPTRDDLLLDQRDDLPRTQDVPFTPFHWGVVTSLATIGEDEEDTALDVTEITICEATDDPPCREVQVVVAHSTEEESVPISVEEQNEPVVEEPIEEISITVPARPDPSTCKIITVLDKEVNCESEISLRSNLLTIDEEEMSQQEDEQDYNDKDQQQVFTESSDIKINTIDEVTSTSISNNDEVILVSVIRKTTSTEILNNNNNSNDDVIINEEVEIITKDSLITESKVLPCEGETYDLKVGEGGHAPSLSTRCLDETPTTILHGEGTESTPVVVPLVAEMPAQAPVIQAPTISIEEVTTCDHSHEISKVNITNQDIDQVDNVVTEKNLGPASLPIFSNVESCDLKQGSEHTDLEVSEMDGLLSLQHPLPYVSKHQNGGGGICTIEDSTSPPPSFSRLPPDGHEFPPNYIEPCPDKLSSILNSTSATTDRRSPKWRQDEKSQKSVRDKIALFSSEKSEPCAVEVVNTTTTSLHNRFRSTEDVSLRHNGVVSNNNSNIVMERAVSTIDLSPQEPVTPTNIPVPRYSTLPRKPTIAPVAPVNVGLGRTMSFSGGAPSLHTRSQSLIDVAGQRRPATSINALLEQRSRGISKLRGLVIPERGEISAPATVVDLPEIRSRDIPLLKPAVRPTSLLEPCTNNRILTSNNKTTSLLPALPTMPKYSPAFKRKSFTVFGDKQENQEITTSKINQPIKPIEAYNKSFNQYYSKSNGNTNGISFVTTIQEPKSLESLSSPRSDISFDELPSVGNMAASEDGDSDSAVSSGRSSPPDARSSEVDGDEPERNSLRRTLSSETASSTASTASSTLTSGSDGCGRRVLKAQSVEAVNRKNVLASARNSNGRPVGLASPLIQRRFDEDDDSSGHYEMHATEEAYYSSANDGDSDSTKTYVVHTVVNGMNTDNIEDDREIKVAYIDEICEVEFMPAVETAPVSPPMISPRKMTPEMSPPVVSPRKILSHETPAPALRVTELRAKQIVDVPSALPPIIPTETVLIVAPVAPSRPPPVVPPRSAPVEPEVPATPPPMSPPPVITPPTMALPTSPPPPIVTRPIASLPMSPPPVPAPVMQVSHDTVDGPQEKTKERWTNMERKYESNTMTRTSVTSPRSSRQEEGKSFKDIAERWQLMSVDAPPKAPTPPQVAPRTTPEKPGRRSASVTDIRRAFERSPQAAAALTVTAPNHARVSSLDSSASEETSSGPSAPASALLSSANSMEQLGSISSLASSTSIISQQELQGLLDEAAQEEGAQGEMLVLVLHRDSLSSSVGITLAGGADYEARDITVHKVLAGSPADRDGRVQKGDRILSINGRSMKNLTHREALTILKAPRPEAVLVIARGRSEANIEDASSPATLRTVSMSSAVTPSQETEAPHTEAATPGTPVLVNMTKDGAGLGFSLEGGRDSPLGDRPLTIKKIFTGGAAEKTGQLSAGDQLLAVNGTDVSSMSRIEAWSLMKRLPLGPVTLLVRPQA